MSTEIDQLVVSIETEGEGGADALDRLADALKRVEAAANGLDGASGKMNRFLGTLKKLHAAAQPAAERTRRLAPKSVRDPDGPGPEVSPKLERVIQNPLADATPEIRGDTLGDVIADGFRRVSETAEPAIRAVRQLRAAAAAPTAAAPAQEPAGPMTGGQEAAEAAGRAAEAGFGWKDLDVSNQKIVSLTRSLEGLQRKKQEMEKSGIGLGYKGYDEAVSRIRVLKLELDQYRAKIEQGNSAVSRARAGFAGLARAGSAAVSGVSTLFNGSLHPLRTAHSLLARFRSALRGTGGDARTASQSFALFGSGILRSVGRILMYRAIRSVLSGVTSGISTGITNLYHANSRFAASMDTCATAAQYLKNSLAAALSPAINALAPVLDYIVDKVVDFINVINQLVAVMTGASTWTKAVKVPAQWAEAADGAAGSAGAANDAAQELQRTLMGFDEINKLNAAPTGGSGSGGAGGSGTDYSSRFTTEQVALDGLTGKLGDIWQVFQDAWESKGAAVLEAARNALDTLKTLAADVGTAFSNVWTDGTGQAFLEGVLERVRSLLDLVSGLAGTFDQAWTQAGTGEGVIRSILDRMTEVDRLIVTLRDSFTAMWNNGTGVSVWTNLLQIITSCNDAVGNLARQFRTAWEDNGAGQRIWQALANAVNDVLEAINQVAKATADWADGLDLSGITGSFARLLEAVEPLVDVISDGLAWAWNHVLLPLAGWTLEIRIPLVVDELASAFEALSAICQALAPAAQQLWDNFLQPLSTLVGGAISAALNAISDALQALFSGAGRVGESVGLVLEYFTSLGKMSPQEFQIRLKAIWEENAESAVDRFAGLTDKNVQVQAGALTSSGYSEFNQAWQEFVKHPIRSATVSASAETKNKSAWDSITGAIQDVVRSPKPLSVSIQGNAEKGNWDNSVYQITQLPNQSAKSVSASLTTSLTSGHRSNLNLFNNTKSNTAQKGITTNLTSGYRTDFNLFHNTKSNTVRKTITTSLTAGHRSNLSYYNNTKSGTVTKRFETDKKKFVTPHISWTTKSKFGIKYPYPSISWYAKGGVFDRPTLAGIGENGPEAVVPLKNNTQWIALLAKKLREQQEGEGAGGGPVVIENHIYLDGKQIYQGTYEDIRRYSGSHNGKLPFPV